jgi:hypothetical protein
VTNPTHALRALDWRALFGVAALLTAAVAMGVAVKPEAYLEGLGLVVFAAAGLMAVLVQSDRPAFGILILLLSSVLMPIEVRGPSAAMVSTSFPLAAGLCGIWLVRMLAVRSGPRLERSRVIVALGTLMCVGTASFAYGLVPLFPAGGAPIPAQIAQLALLLVSGCLFLMVAHQLSESHVRWLSWAFVVAGTLAALTLVIPALDRVGSYTTRPGSVGSLFWTWLVAISASQAIFNRELRPIARLALVGVTLLVMGHGLIQVRSWASGWLPPLVVLGVLGLLRAPVLTIGVTLVGAPAGLLTWGYLSDAMMAEESYSLLTRQEAWRVLWNLVELSPIIGTGPANYYYYTENFSIMGWYVRFISHNNYQDFLVQNGFLGLLAFCWFGFEAALYALRSYRRATVGFSRAFAAGALGGVLGSLASGMLGDWIVPFYYNAGIIGFRSSLLFWLFGGAMLALERSSEGARAEALFTARRLAGSVR